jgi:hypothetical protein
MSFHDADNWGWWANTGRTDVSIRFRKVDESVPRQYEVVVMEDDNEWQVRDLSAVEREMLHTLLRNVFTESSEGGDTDA